MNHREQWDARFAAEGYVFGTRPNAFLVTQAHRLPAGAAILAVADGEGRNGVWLAEQGHRVTSVDISEKGQAKAARLAASRGVTLDLRLADFDGWAWAPDAYDAVVAIFIQFADPMLRTRMFEGIKRTIRPGGLLIMQGYTPEQIGFGTGGPRDVANLYTPALLEAAFAGWSFSLLDTHCSVIEEGPGHSGMSALIDFVAVKPQ